jgi:tRNA A37 threonylcarbamoyladenosine dehydratase
MKVWGQAGGIHVMLVDGDQVSATNCVRQPFASADVGLNKATVLINRVNLFWGLRWQAYPEHFHKDSLRTNSAGPHLIIGCVDTRAARQAILSAVTRANDSTVCHFDSVPAEPERSLLDFNPALLCRSRDARVAKDSV